MYGHPADVYELVAQLWGAYMQVDYQAEDVAMMLALLKVAREKNADYPLDFTDNQDDLAGYANVLAMIKEEHGKAS